MINRHSSRGRSESADERAYNLLRTSTLHRVVAERPPRGKIATPLAAIHSQHAAAWVREGPHTRLFNFSKRLQVPEQNSDDDGVGSWYLVSLHTRSDQSLSVVAGRHLSPRQVVELLRWSTSSDNRRRCPPELRDDPSAESTKFYTHWLHCPTTDERRLYFSPPRRYCSGY